MAPHLRPHEPGRRGDVGRVSGWTMVHRRAPSVHAMSRGSRSHRCAAPAWDTPEPGRNGLSQALADGRGLSGEEEPITMSTTTARTADIYRLVTDEHICPYGLKSLDLLQREGLEVNDHQLRSEEEASALREDLGVETTPQTFIDGELIGTLDDLRRHFGRDVPADSDGTSYRPVVALFITTFLMAVASTWVAEGTLLVARTVEWFVAFTMCGLGYLKLRDVEGFSLMFLNYDLLAATRALQLRVPLRRDRCRAPHDRGGPALVVGACRAVHRLYRCSLGDQGGLRRWPRAEVRLRRREQRRAPRVRIAHGERRDGGHRYVDAVQVAVVTRPTTG